MAFDPVLSTKMLDVYQQLVHTLIKYKFVESNTGLVFFRIRCQSVLARQGSFCFWTEPFVISKETKLCLADFHSPVRISVIKTAPKMQGA